MTPAEPMPIVLRVGELPFELAWGRPLVVGSAPDADIKIGHHSIDDRHATVEVTDDAQRIRIRDLGSAHGTWIDGARIEDATIGLGTPLRFGSIDARLEQFVPDVTQASAAASHAQRFTAPSFDELMADQLRRAPWFAISVLAHAIAIALLWIIASRIEPKAERRITMSMLDEEPTLEIDEESLAEETIETEEIVEDVILESVDEDTSFDAPDATANAAEGAAFLEPDWIDEGMMQPVRIGAGKDILAEFGGGAKSGFRNTVRGLRKSGIDIVFVFDSTHSMKSVLEQTKQRIELMVDVLHALVRGARIGVVTYRDRGEYEEYLTRHVPLTTDYYHTINFMQTVYAAGGGDFPEAVKDAMEVAMRQHWRRGAQRVVVLIGDAPARPDSMNSLKDMLRAFTRTEKSSVHTIMTKRRDGEIDEQTRDNYEMIAKLGKGSCIPLEDEKAILRDIMALTIGQKFREDLDKVYAAVFRERSNISRRARDAVAREDVDAVHRALLKTRPDDNYVRALVDSRSPKLAAMLVDLLHAGETPKRTRQAAAYVLQRTLGLMEPPTNTERAEPLDASTTQRLNLRIERTLQQN